MSDTSSNNYFHMKLREHREEIARLKKELEASERKARMKS
tara:strand:+ start:2919 stop:3038 length:120 start_codon:yes stop_codon:yes gene_type:complete